MSEPDPLWLEWLVFSICRDVEYQLAVRRLMYT